MQYSHNLFLKVLGGFLVFLGIVCWGAGLDMPGTTGHDGSGWLTLMAVSGGTLAASAGALLMKIAGTQMVTRGYKLLAAVILVSSLAFALSIFQRGIELGIY